MCTRNRNDPQLCDGCWGAALIAVFPTAEVVVLSKDDRLEIAKRAIVLECTDQIESTNRIFDIGEA
jgi:hypothetical protein